MAQFPGNARAGQTHRKFGRKFVYSETTEAWTPVVTLASVAEVKRTAAANASAVTTYSLASQLPLSDNTTGALAFVGETNRLYLWSGTGWYNVATIESAGSSISGVSASYTLATDGTPTVVTLSQSGLTSPTWSYEVTSGSLGRTATVTQADNVFTITPSTLAKNVGSFGLTFKATDGSNTIVKNSQFTMSNTAPVIGTGPNATYSLSHDGTPTVITLAATDADGHAITWSYEVVSGSLGGTTVSIVGSEFTITPSSNQVDAGEFQLRFIASDGVLFDAEVSAFTLAFAPDWTTTTLLHSITNPNTYGDTASDQFGYQSCGISGNYAVVGARLASDAGGGMSGMLYVFNVTTGALLHSIANPNAYGTSANDMFTWPIAISGNYVIAGATDEDEAAGNNSGKAYIFDVTTGALVYTLDNPNAYSTVTSDNFGTSVSIFGNHAIVAAAGEDDAGGNASGKAYIFKTTLGDWTDTTLLHTLDNPNAYGTSGSDYFGYHGYTVAIDSTHAIVGAFGENDAGGDYSGKAYIFNVATGALVHTLDNPNGYGTSANDGFGQAVAISGNYAIVGAQDEQDAGGNQSGKAYIFNVATGALLFTLDNPATTAQDQFGNAVSIEGNFAIVSARHADAYAGRVYIFDVTTGTLIKTLVNPNVNASAADDRFGHSIGMSGNHILVVAISEDVGATSSGQAYIFQASY